MSSTCEGIHVNYHNTLFWKLKFFLIQFEVGSGSTQVKIHGRYNCLNFVNPIWNTSNNDKMRRRPLLLTTSKKIASLQYNGTKFDPKSGYGYCKNRLLHLNSVYLHLSCLLIFKAPRKFSTTNHVTKIILCRTGMHDMGVLSRFYTKKKSCTGNGNLFISIGFLPIAKSMSHKQQAFGRSMSEVNS